MRTALIIATVVVAATTINSKHIVSASTPIGFCPFILFSLKLVSIGCLISALTVVTPPLIFARILIDDILLYPLKTY